MQMSPHERMFVLLGDSGMIRIPRPGLISWLAATKIVSGAGLLVAVAALHGRLGALGAAFGVSPRYVDVSLLFIGALSLAAGVGMWRGTRWGWWLAAFFWAYAIARHANVLLMASGMAGQPAGETPGIEYNHLKHTLRLVFYAGLLWYLFQNEILRFFGLRGMHKGRAVALLALPLALVVAVRLVSLL